MGTRRGYQAIEIHQILTNGAHERSMVSFFALYQRQIESHLIVGLLPPFAETLYESYDDGSVEERQNQHAFTLGT